MIYCMYNDYNWLLYTNDLTHMMGEGRGRGRGIRYYIQMIWIHGGGGGGGLDCEMSYNVSIKRLWCQHKYLLIIFSIESVLMGVTWHIVFNS